MVFVGVLSGANEVDFKDQKVSISSLFQFVNTYKHIAWEQGSILRWITGFDGEPVSPSDGTIVWLWDKVNFEAFLSKSERIEYNLS